MIESPKNARVQSLLRARDEGKVFVLEGEKFVLDAAAAGFPFEEIFHDDSIKPGDWISAGYHQASSYYYQAKAWTLSWRNR